MPVQSHIAHFFARGAAANTPVLAPDPQERTGLLGKMDRLAEATGQCRGDMEVATRGLLDALASGDREGIASRQDELGEAVQSAYELGLPGDEEFESLAAQWLNKRDDDTLNEVDATIAAHGNADTEGRLAQIAGVVTQARIERAMPGAGASKEETARWQRQQRDVSLQLKWLSRPVAGRQSLERAARTLPIVAARDKSDDQRAHEFGCHVTAALETWDDKRLICLHHNLGVLSERDDPETQRCLFLVRQAVSQIVARKGIDMSAPEPMLLSMAEGAFDPAVAVGWLREGKIGEADLQGALGRWTDESLNRMVRFEQRNIAKYGPLADAARAVLQAREEERALAPGAASRYRAATFIERLGYRRYIDRSGSVPAGLSQAAGQSRQFVARYTTWGSRASVGSALNTALRWATLSEPARRVGNWVQRGHDSGARYLAGAVIKGLASITGAASGIVAGVVTVAETIVSRVLENTARIAGGVALGFAAAGAKAAGLASPAANKAGDRIAGAAKNLVGGISLVSNKGKQSELPAHMADRVGKLALLARITGSTTADVRAMALPDGFSRAGRDVIPRDVLSLEGGGTGKASKLRYNEVDGSLTGDKWSGLKIGVYVETDAQGNGIAYHLSFVGTQGKRPATIKSDVAQSAFGFEDSAFQEADAVVKAFVARYGADKVKLQGHSLGGGLAQWAGIRNSGGDHPVEVTCFNGAGLHINMRNRLGEALVAKANVTHINTAKDSLSQKLEGARSPFLGAQIGRRYVIPESKGHSLRHHVEGLEQYAA